MTDDDRLYLGHIADRIGRVERYTADGRDAFLVSTLVEDAVVQSFTVIGEAVQQLSEDARRREPDIPWRRVAGFRGVLTHDYVAVDPDLVWSTPTESLPALKTAVERLRR